MQNGPGTRRYAPISVPLALAAAVFLWSVDDELGGWAAVDDAAAPEDDKLGA